MCACDIFLYVSCASFLGVRRVEGVSRFIPSKGLGAWNGRPDYVDLLPDAQPLDQIRVAVDVLCLQVVEQRAALTDEHQQAAP